MGNLTNQSLSSPVFCIFQKTYVNNGLYGRSSYNPLLKYDNVKVFIPLYVSQSASQNIPLPLDYSTYISVSYLHKKQYQYQFSLILYKKPQHEYIKDAHKTYTYRYTIHIDYNCSRCQCNSYNMYNYQSHSQYYTIYGVIPLPLGE